MDQIKVPATFIWPSARGAVVIRGGDLVLATPSNHACLAHRIVDAFFQTWSQPAKARPMSHVRLRSPRHARPMSGVRGRPLIKTGRRSSHRWGQIKVPATFIWPPE